jgi:hypothetical protein
MVYLMSETFTKWWRRNRERIAEDHLTVDEAQAEIAALRHERRIAQIEAAAIEVDSWPEEKRKALRAAIKAEEKAELIRTWKWEGK